MARSPSSRAVTPVTTGGVSNSPVARRASLLHGALKKRLTSGRSDAEAARAKLAAELEREQARTQIIRQALSPEAELFLQELFARNDTDSSAHMDVAELSAMVHKDLKIRMSDDEITELATQFDADSDGQLNVNEFLCLMAARTHMPDASEAVVKAAFQVRRACCQQRWRRALRPHRHTVAARGALSHSRESHFPSLRPSLTPFVSLRLQRFDKVDNGAHTGSLGVRETIEMMKVKGSLSAADVRDLEDMFAHALEGECRDPEAEESILYEKFADQMFRTCRAYDAKVNEIATK